MYKRQFLRYIQRKRNDSQTYLQLNVEYSKFSNKLVKVSHVWAIILIGILGFGTYQFYIKNNAQRSPENVVKAYYDALDFKEFEKAHSFINPENELTIAQYMLEISSTDGLLSSYAKLDAIETKITKETDSLATLKVITKWITPLEKIEKSDYKTVVKYNGKWFLEPEPVEADLPPDQLFSNNKTAYFNHGRRRITTEQTHHEDVLKQPVLEIISAKLVNHNGHYAIVGEVQNIDNVPADVVLKGTLYNDANVELATYNAKYHMKHKLMPKEVTSFRINFEGIAWSKTQDSIPETFNPDEFTPVELADTPTKFNLQAAGNVSGSDLYKNIVLSDLNIDQKTINGNLFNSGLQEVTVPQLLVTYYDENKEILWVDHMFLDKGIRQQRKQPFSYKLSGNDSMKIISSDMENCYVNGLPNADISAKILSNRKNYNVLQKITHPIYSYVKIETNAYIGNPK